MYLRRFYDDNLAHASYMVGCQATGEAIVIDPSRDVSPYLETAKKQDLKITKVTETHVHADFLSGTRQMVHQTGATAYLSKEGGEDWQYRFATDDDVLVGDGDIIEVGNLTLKVIHTPGHTPEHISLLLTDHPATDKPIGAFTGDFLFVGDVGRPDLLEEAAGQEDTMKESARQLYQSLQRFTKLPDHIQIWPAHGAGSACGKSLGAIPSSVLAYEKISNWAFQCESEADFVKSILDGQPEPPKYFAKMKEWNVKGPELLPESLPAHLPKEKMAELHRDGLLVDLRGGAEFAERHPERAVYLPYAGPFVTWAGWLLPYDKPFHLLLKDESQLQDATHALRSIGLDKIAGFYTSSDLSPELEYQSSTRIPAEELDVEAHSILDVRSQSEWEEGHLEGAKHIHLGYLLDNLEKVPENPVVHCGSGVRSLIASSLLQRAGKDPVDVKGGFRKIKQEKRELVTA